MPIQTRGVLQLCHITLWGKWIRLLLPEAGTSKITSFCPLFILFYFCFITHSAQGCLVQRVKTRNWGWNDTYDSNIQPFCCLEWRNWSPRSGQIISLSTLLCVTLHTILVSEVNNADVRVFKHLNYKACVVLYFSYWQQTSGKYQTNNVLVCLTSLLCLWLSPLVPSEKVQ